LWQDRSVYEEIWPYLTLISCWSDGHASHYVESLKALFPNVEIQPKGLIATEAFISFPMIDKSGSVLSINSHFFEFVEEGGEKNTKLAHQLNEGKYYSVIVTTGGGLYRYQLQDIIKVVGFSGQLPLIQFIGKNDNISDFMGEKLNGMHVEETLKRTFKDFNINPKFFMVAPENNSTNHCFYTLFIESDGLNDNQLRSIGKKVDEGLCTNFHYAYCRRLEQLLPLKVYSINTAIQDPAELYLAHQISFGKKAGDIKPLVLDRHTGWTKVFKGRYIDA